MTWTLGKTVLHLRCSGCAYVLTTTFEDCPEEEELPCPTGCGGSIRTRPTKPKPVKKKVVEEQHGQAP